MIYDLNYSPVELGESIVVSTLVSMVGGDAREYEDNSYCKWLIFLNRDGEDGAGDTYSLCLYPVAKDGSSEYDVPFAQIEFDGEDDWTDEILKTYNHWVYIALSGMVEIHLA